MAGNVISCFTFVFGNDGGRCGIHFISEKGYLLNDFTGIKENMDAYAYCLADCYSNSGVSFVP